MQNGTGTTHVKIRVLHKCAKLKYVFGTQLRLDVQITIKPSNVFQTLFLSNCIQVFEECSLWSFGLIAKNVWNEEFGSRIEEVSVWMRKDWRWALTVWWSGPAGPPCWCRPAGSCLRSAPSWWPSATLPLKRTRRELGVRAGPAGGRTAWGTVRRHKGRTLQTPSSQQQRGAYIYPAATFQSASWGIIWGRVSDRDKQWDLSGVERPRLYATSWQAECWRREMGTARGWQVTAGHSVGT